MSGFSGATGVPLKQMQDAIAQSTAIAYGVGTNIPSNSNFNNYTSPGAYSVASQAIAESITNIPYRQAGRLEVRGTLSTYIIQYYYPYTNVNRFYMRRYTNAWSDWYEYDDITQSTAKAHDISTEESHGAAYVAGDTFSLPGFSSLGINDLIVILARRWGYVSSVCIRKGVITAGIASNVILRNATGDAATDIIKLNISSSGVVTIVSASNGFFPEAYYIKGQ